MATSRGRARSTDTVTGNTELIIEQLRESCIWVRAVTRVKPGKDDEMWELAHGRGDLHEPRLLGGVEPEPVTRG